MCEKNENIYSNGFPLDFPKSTHVHPSPRIHAKAHTLVLPEIHQQLTMTTQARATLDPRTYCYFILPIKHQNVIFI
eukprot:m.84763 g.84763  ORF g.84763 m.84763 type:complete len:76 (-) comp12168_c0_seq5:1347-1574(-)